MELKPIEKNRNLNKTQRISHTDDCVEKPSTLNLMNELNNNVLYLNTRLCVLKLFVFDIEWIDLLGIFILPSAYKLLLLSYYSVSSLSVPYEINALDYTLKMNTWFSWIDSFSTT